MCGRCMLTLSATLLPMVLPQLASKIEDTTYTCSTETTYTCSIRNPIVLTLYNIGLFGLSQWNAPNSCIHTQFIRSRLHGRPLSFVNAYTISTCVSAACACTQCWTTATMVTVPDHLCSHSHTPYESSHDFCRDIGQCSTPRLSTASEQSMSAIRHSLAATPRHHCTAATGQC